MTRPPLVGRRVARAARRALLGEPEPWPARLPEAWLDLRRAGPVPLADSGPAADGPLSLAIVLPAFRHASGGHQTIVHLARELVARGHRLGLWLEDDGVGDDTLAAAQTAERFASFFSAPELEFHTDFSGWRGADVVVATGWQTVPRVLRLAGAGARAYLVQDHEPEFYPTSAEALLAAESYRLGLPCIAASPWLAELLRERYGAQASSFDLAVDHAIYRPGPAAAGADLVAFYARAETPRRALPIGLLALEELARRRPATRIALFGDAGTTPRRFAHEDHATLAGRALAQLYGTATVGLSLSLTNPSLIPLEMMACGLPCVELASEPMRETFGVDGPLLLAAPDPLALCDALQRLLDDPSERARRRAQGITTMRDRTWSAAAAVVEQALRAART